MSGHRNERVGQRIQEVVTRLLRENIRDPRIGFVTLTGVDLSSDLRHARIYVSALGDAAAQREALAGLRRAAPFFRRAVGREVGLRFTPELVFLEDTALHRGFRVERILDDLRESAPDTPPDATAPDTPPDATAPDTPPDATAPGRTSDDDAESEGGTPA